MEMDCLRDLKYVSGKCYVRVWNIQLVEDSVEWRVSVIGSEPSGPITAGSNCIIQFSEAWPF